MPGDVALDGLGPDDNPGLHAGALGHNEVAE
jgi:hypothetical protein